VPMESAIAPCMGGKTAPPETPITRMPAPRRVWRPRFAVPSVKSVGYIGASKKKSRMSWICSTGCLFVLLLALALHVKANQDLSRLLQRRNSLDRSNGTRSGPASKFVRPTAHANSQSRDPPPPSTSSTDNQNGIDNQPNKSRARPKNTLGTTNNNNAKAGDPKSRPRIGADRKKFKGNYGDGFGNAFERRFGHKRPDKGATTASPNE